LKAPGTFTGWFFLRGVVKTSSSSDGALYRSVWGLDCGSASGSSSVSCAAASKLSSPRLACSCNNNMALELAGCTPGSDLPLSRVCEDFAGVGSWYLTFAGDIFTAGDELFSLTTGSNVILVCFLRLDLCSISEVMLVCGGQCLWDRRRV